MSKKRIEFSEEYKWDLSGLFKNVSEFNKAFKELEDTLPEFEKFKGHIMDSNKSLLETLDFMVDYEKKLERVYAFAHLNNDSDTLDTDMQALYKRAHALLVKYYEVTSFMTPEILKSDYSLTQKYMEENSHLKKYSTYLKNIFRVKKYVLSEKEEKILSSFSQVMSHYEDAFEYLADSDMTFGSMKNENGEKEEINERSYRRMIECSNRAVRKKVFMTLMNRYGDFKNTFASLLSGEANKNNKLASIRGYESALASSLIPHDIPEEIYFNLLKAVKKNAGLQTKFWNLKKKILNVPTLHLYDVNASTTKESGKKYSPKDAEDLIMKALKPMGETYLKDLKKAFEEKWIDYPDNEGKRSGAYCTVCYVTHPYVLTNFNGTLSSVSTLAHELGHAMHYYYAITNQEYQDYGYSIFVAEVASQVNQILLSMYLIEHSDSKEEKIFLIDDLIRDFKSSVYRQTMFADFEYQIHKMDADGISLTHENMSELYYKLNKEYFGKGIVIDDVIKYEWARIPHLYYHFYVYQYATAYTAAIKIATNILAKKEGVLEGYLEFLKLGCTASPIDSLAIAGVDMTKDDALNDAFIYFEDLINKLEKLYKEV